MNRAEGSGHAAEPRKAVAWLDGYPGAAFLVARDLTPIALNAHAGEVAPLLVDDTSAGFAALVEKAAHDHAIAVDIVELSTGEVDIAMDVTVVPQDDGGSFLVLTRDITMERNLRPALIESRQRYKDLVEVSSDFAWEVGPDGTFVFVSSQNALGYSVDELLGRRPADLVVDAATYRPLPFVSDQALDNVELWMHRPDGTLACVLVSCRPLHSRDGTWLGARGVCRDITRDREREAALMQARHREQILHYVIRAIRSEVEPQNMLTAAAGAATRALGAAGCRIFRKTAPGEFTQAAEFGETEGIEGLEALLTGIEEVDSTFDREVATWSVLGAVTDYRAAINGGVFLWKAAGFAEWTDDERFLASDVADQLGIAIEQINNHERIVRLSRTDALTGLLNRRAFYQEEMPRRLRRLERDRATAALYYVDLDNFKAVNDRFGHQRGDEALIALRDLMLEYSRPGDLIARLGGDEFVMWLDGISLDVAERRAGQLVAAAGRLSVFSDESDAPLGISVGVAFYEPATGETLDELLARADVAMYSVKRGSKGGYRLAPPPSTEDRPARGP